MKRSKQKKPRPLNDDLSDLQHAERYLQERHDAADAKWSDLPILGHKFEAVYLYDIHARISSDQVFELKIKPGLMCYLEQLSQKARREELNVARELLFLQDQLNKFRREMEQE